MSDITKIIQTADWKTEKHVPVIDAPNTVKKGEVLRLNVSVGKEIAHPNTTEHHIRWIEVYFHPSNEKFPYQVARFEFSAHGESIQGPNTSTIFTAPDVSCAVRTEKAGSIYAVSYCNIHGLWQSSKEITVQ
jgi:superoxide reductase